MYCSHCGKKIPLHSEYCPYCGHKQPHAKSSQIKTEPKQHKQQLPKRTQQTHYIDYRKQFKDFYKHNKRYCWGTVGVAIIIALLCVGIYHHHETTRATPPTVTQQSSQSSQSHSNNSDSNDDNPNKLQSEHFVGPSAKTVTTQTLRTVWTEVASDASATGLPQTDDSTLYFHFIGGKNNHSYRMLNEQTQRLAHSTKFNHDHVTMKPTNIHVTKDGSRLKVTYTIDCFFPEKLTPNNDPTPRTGLYEHVVHHAVLTKHGKKIISSKADSQPIYKHYNHQESD